MKKQLAFFMVLQLLFASLMATSHLAVAGSDVHEKPHFHLIDSSEHCCHEASTSLVDIEHTCEIHISLTFLEASSFDALMFSPSSLRVASENTFFINSLIKPLLPPPNISV